MGAGPASNTILRKIAGAVSGMSSPLRDQGDPYGDGKAGERIVNLSKKTVQDNRRHCAGQISCMSHCIFYYRSCVQEGKGRTEPPYDIGHVLINTIYIPYFYSTSLSGVSWQDHAPDQSILPSKKHCPAGTLEDPRFDTVDLLEACSFIGTSHRHSAIIFRF